MFRYLIPVGDKFPGTCELWSSGHYSHGYIYEKGCEQEHYK